MKLNIVVVLHGGIVKEVLVDDVKLDAKVVVTKNPKFMDGGEKIVKIDDGNFKDEAIDSVLNANHITKKSLDPVLKAAKIYEGEEDEDAILDATWERENEEAEEDHDRRAGAYGPEYPGEQF